MGCRKRLADGIVTRNPSRNISLSIFLFNIDIKLIYNHLKYVVKPANKPAKIIEYV